MTQDETQGLKALLEMVLGPASGTIQQIAMPWILDQLEETGRVLSPFGKRWLAIGLSVALPSVLYLAGAFWFQYWPYSSEDHLLAILAAFGFSQGIHSFRLSREPQVQAPAGYVLPTSDSIVATPHLAPTSTMNPSPYTEIPGIEEAMLGMPAQGITQGVFLTDEDMGEGTVEGKPKGTD
jgi:hypothetical protein